MTTPGYPYSIWARPYPTGQQEEVDREGMVYVGEYSDLTRAQSEALRMATRVHVLHCVRDENNLIVSYHYAPGEAPMSDRYDSLQDLASKIEWEGTSYFFEDYGFSADQLPEDAPPEVVAAAQRVDDDPDDLAARRAFLALLPME